jgi:hypothetical protein
VRDISRMNYEGKIAHQRITVRTCRLSFSRYCMPRERKTHKSQFSWDEQGGPMDAYEDTAVQNLLG